MDDEPEPQSRIEFKSVSTSILKPDVIKKEPPLDIPPEQVVPTKTASKMLHCANLFRCSICNTDFASELYLSYHMNIHNGVVPFECRVTPGCLLRFTHPERRNRHESVCAGESTGHSVFGAALPSEVEPAVEPSTSKEGPKKSGEIGANATKVITVYCVGCRASFSSSEAMMEHKRTCRARHACSVCGKEVTSLKQLNFHMNRHSDLKPYECRKETGCKRKFFSPNTRTKHEANCKGPKRWEVGLECEPSHSGTVLKPYACRVTPGCRASYRDPRLREYHESKCKNRVHAFSHRRKKGYQREETKPMACAGCGKLFTSQLLLSRHQVGCNVSSVCVVCGKAMSSIEKLKDHMNGHKGLRPFKCRVLATCQAKYPSRSGRYAHEKRCYARKMKSSGTTGNDNQFQCDRCGQDLASNPQLVEHQRVCSVSRKCELCDRVFERNNKYREHMNKHAGIKPYQCRESAGCGESFHSSGARSRHEQNCAKSHGSEQISCMSCGKTFIKISHYEKHKPYCDGQNLAAEPELADDVAEEEGGNVVLSVYCVGCGESFSSTEALMGHKGTCHNRIICCTICGKEFKSVPQLNIHMNRHSGVKPYRCRVSDGCPAQFHGPYFRVKHERICRGPVVTDPEEGKCRLCGKELDKQSIVHICEELNKIGDDKRVVKWSCLKEVMDNTIKAKEQVDQQCEVEAEKVEIKVEPTLLDEEDLLEPTSAPPSTEEAMPYQCRQSANCPERFANAQFRRNHEVMCGKARKLGAKSSRVELVVCRLCGKVCNGKQFLRVHKELCGPDAEMAGELKCTVCPEVCDNVDKLQEHLNEHNREFLGEKVLKCRASPNCTKTFTLARVRIDHELECDAAGQAICSKCYKLLPNHETLLEHEEACQATEFVCRLCDGTYSDVRYLRKHLLDHESPGRHARWWEKPKANPVMPQRERHYCNNCGTEFASQEELQKHPQFCKFTFTCPQCPAAFSKIDTLRCHVNMHNGVKPYKCRKPGCDKSFSMSAHRRDHEMVCGTSKEAEQLRKVELYTAKTAKLFSCPHCPETFKAVNELKFHVNEHKADKIYPCRQSEDCKETFTTRGFRTKHEAICGKISAPKQPRKVELIACKECGKVFSNLQYLRIHKQKCTGSENGPPANLKCTLCKVISPDVEVLQAHLDGHNREKPFKCRMSKACSEAYINERQRGNHELVCNADGQAICQRCFKLCPCLETLKVHEKTCRGTEFPCRLCEVVLRSRNSQLVHLLRHDANKKVAQPMHACPSCDKQFQRRSNFLLHIKEHGIEEKDLQLKCEICAVAFKCPKALQIHMDCHKGIKSFKCRYQGCEEAFFQPSGREFHEQNCTKVCITCEICEVKINCMRDYQQHMKSHDGSKVDEL